MLGTTSGSAQAISLIAMALISRTIDAEIYGQYIYLLAILAVGRDLANGQLYRALVRELPGSLANGENILKSNFILELVAGIIATTVVFVASLTSFQGGQYNDNITYLVVIALSGLTLITYLHRAILSSFHALGKTDLMGFWELIPNIFFILILVTLIYAPAYQSYSIDPVVIGLILTAKLSAFLITFILFYRYISENINFRSDGQLFETCIKLFKISVFPMLSGWLSIIYYNTDRFMLMWYGNNYLDVGTYYNGFILGLAISFGCATFVKIIYPLLSDEKFKMGRIGQNKHIKLYNHLLFYFIVPICIIMYHFSEDIVSLLFGHQYIESAKILQIYLPFVFLNVSIGPGLSILFLENQQKFLMFSLSVACIVNVLLNMILIPNMGPAGAMYATGFGILSNVLLVYFRLVSIFNRNYIFSLRNICILLTMIVPYVFVKDADNYVFGYFLFLSFLSLSVLFSSLKKQNIEGKI